MRLISATWEGVWVVAGGIFSKISNRSILWQERDAWVFLVRVWSVWRLEAGRDVSRKNIRWESRFTSVANTETILSPGSLARVLLLDSRPGAVTVRE